MVDFRAHNDIHPTAILDGEIRMGEGNVIGPHAVLRGHITLGDHNQLAAGVVLTNRVVMGNQNRVFDYAAIGAVGEMGKKGDRLSDDGQVTIGNAVTIREMVVIHSPVYKKATTIGNGVYLMNKTYVAHDCEIGDHSVLSSTVMLGGNVVLGRQCNVGMGASIHQRMAVGDYAMIGMQSVVVKPIVPFCKVAGNPARILGLNVVGIQEVGFSADVIHEAEVFFLGPKKEIENTKNPILLQIRSFIDHHPESLIRLKDKS